MTIDGGPLPAAARHERTVGRVAQLWVFPVKSMSGASVESADGRGRRPGGRPVVGGRRRRRRDRDRGRGAAAARGHHPAARRRAAPRRPRCPARARRRGGRRGAVRLARPAAAPGPPRGRRLRRRRAGARRVADARWPTPSTPSSATPATSARRGPTWCSTSTPAAPSATGSGPTVPVGGVVLRIVRGSRTTASGPTPRWPPPGSRPVGDAVTVEG